MTEDLHQLAGAYALDALDDVERLRFERHLDECPACVDEVEGFLDTTAVLAAAEPVAVPPHLRAAVLDEVDRTRQVSPLSGRVRRRLPRLGQVAAGLLAVVAVTASTIAVQLDQRVDQLEQLAAPVAEIAAAADVVLADATVDDARVRVLASPTRGDGVVLADGLPQLDADSTYQLWWIGADGSVASAGLMEVDASGAATVSVEGDVAGAMAFGVSVEPSGGSAAPTTDPIAVATL